MSGKKQKNEMPEVIGQPFEDAQEAWFWFIQCHEATKDGARVTARKGQIARLCEPVDIMRILDRLWRQRRLVRDHLLVLRHYGQRMLPPDPYRPQEAKAHTIWTQAMDRMEPILIKKGLIEAREEFHTHEGAQQEERIFA